MTTDFRARFVTWNVSESEPPDDLEYLLGLDDTDTKLPQLIAVGLQEVKFAASESKIEADCAFGGPWVRRMTKVLRKHHYVRVESIRMIGILLSVFIQRTELHSLSRVGKTFTPTGMSGGIAVCSINKGGVSVSLDVQGVSLCIVNCHLAAHIERCAQRIDDVRQILRKQKFKNGYLILDHDYVFWMGDLNFRINDVSNPQTKMMIAQRHYTELVKHDQLQKAKLHGTIFKDFNEGSLDFDPTFKYDIGTDTYDTSSKHRKPAWCDRILWRVNQQNASESVRLSVTQHSLKSFPKYTISDHKPVTSDFSIFSTFEHKPEPDIKFEHVDNWVSNRDAEVSYSVSSNFEVTSLDWIAIYPSDFPTFQSYVTQVWTPTSGSHTQNSERIVFKLSVSHHTISECSRNSYILGYYSNRTRSMVGFSNQFDIKYPSGRDFMQYFLIMMLPLFLFVVFCVVLNLT